MAQNKNSLSLTFFMKHQPFQGKNNWNG